MTDTTLNQARLTQRAIRQASTAADVMVRRLWMEAALTDSGHPLYTDPAAPHWHVKRHREDDDVYAVGTVFEALDYAASELDRIADHENDGITGLGDAGDFEGAYLAFQRVTRWANLVEVARTAHANAQAAPWERPPLYKGPDERENVDRMQRYARDCVRRICENGPGGFAVWECAGDDCAPTDDDDEN